MRIRATAIATSTLLVLGVIAARPAGAQFPGTPGRFLSAARRSGSS